MKRNATLFVTIIVAIFMLPGCFEILEIVQPTEVDEGGAVSVQLTGRTNSDDPNAKWAIIGLQIPTDWTVDGISYDGDVGTGDMYYLGDASGQYDNVGMPCCWPDTLELYFPSPANMHWVVWEGEDSHLTNGVDTNYVDFDISMHAGTMTGVFPIGYFFSESAENFENTQYYADSLGNNITVGTVGIADEITVVKGFSLDQNYPNPFNPMTQISYTLPNAGDARLVVYSILGQEVAVLANGFHTAGTHTATFDASSVPSGIYFYRLTGEGVNQTRKMALVK